jgi:hypothetical protein
MRKSLWIILILLLFAAIRTPNARADIITDYTITFTGASPSLTPAGSFTYDSTVLSFSNFLVVWDGITFDLTSAANNPVTKGTLPTCLTSASGATATFSLLTDCASDPNAAWSAIGSTPEFFIFDTPPVATGVISVRTIASQPPTSDAAAGTFEVSAITTPEPGTSSLMLIGIGLVSVMRKRTSQIAS